MVEENYLDHEVNYAVSIIIGIKIERAPNREAR